MSAQNVTLVALLDSLQALPRGTERLLHVRVLRTEIGPFLPSDLHGFIVLQFDENGEQIAPSGDEDSPFVYALNEELSEGEQLSTFISFVLEAVHRQELDTTVEPGSVAAISSLTAGRSMAAEHARQLAVDLVRVASAEGGVATIVSALNSPGVRIVAGIDVDLRPTRTAIINASKFLRKAYNSVSIVRDTVDRIVYTTVGQGSRITAESEMVRQFAERFNTDLNMRHIMRQSFRDSQLFGTSCMVVSTESDLAVRLIRPDAVDFSVSHNRLSVIDRSTNESWPADSMLVTRGVEQKGSPFGVSILEPSFAALSNLFIFQGAVATLLAAASSIPPVLLPLAESLLLVAEERRAAAEHQLERLFRFPAGYLPLDRDNLYFPGWELWNP
jgi:hypothetical protein